MLPSFSAVAPKEPHVPAIPSNVHSLILRITPQQVMLAALLCVLSFGWANPAAARTLHWPSLTVDLRIDEEGLLRITERHEMMFDGDWNGGERTFQLRSWQDLELVSVSEILPDSGTRVDLVDGDLDAVNEFRLSDKTLRWRNRLPSDPPFAHTLKTYEIVYTIEGALLGQNDANIYRLDHDLAFPDRNGVIERFEATIELAPAWQAADLPPRIERQNLAPGQSVFVTAALEYVGGGKPSAAVDAPEVGSTSSYPMLRYVSIALVIALALLFILNWLRNERALGRFEPPISLDNVDESWLAANVFRMRPEVVGSVWDRKTSSAEVAALIARLVQEGKLSSTVTRSGWGPFKRDNLHLKLLRPREDFESYARRLIDRVFFDDADSVDTDAIREHYKKTGFHPAGLIEAPIKRMVPAVFKSQSSVPGWRKWMTAGLLLTGTVLMVVSWIRSPDAAFPSVMALATLTVLYVIGSLYAYSYSEHVLDTRARALRAFVVPIVIALGLAWLLLGRQIPLVTLQLLAMPVLVLGVLNSIFNTMHCRQTLKGMQLRKALATARKYFERELASEHPILRDEWFPYLLAFDLGPNVDRWFKSFGAHTGTHSHFGTTSGSSSAGSTSMGSSSWTGGGGTFGGAGASGSWASAVAGVAAGVAPPSSSGGSGGGSSGGGGGGSSGGGGGGGW